MQKPTPHSTHKSQQGLRLGNFLFNPGLIPTLATLIVLSILLKLGFWQVQRAGEKDYLQSRFDSRSQLGTLGLQELLKTPGDINDYPVAINGHFDNQYNLLLDNQIYQSQAGYHLLTLFIPFASPEPNQALWVNRGWLPVGQNRAILPPIPPLHGQHTLQGRVYVPSNKVFLLKKDNYQQVSWPLRVQSVDLDSLESVLGVQLLPFTLRLNPKNDNSNLPREWHNNPMGADKHKAYALQWFAMGLVLILIYIITNTHKIKQNNEQI